MNDHLLLLAADPLDDLERTRIATNNRLGALAGYGLDQTPEHGALAAVVEGVGALEHAATLSLQRLMRGHPLAEWVTTTKGVGLKSAARLLAATGDPYWNTLHDRPRTVSELWAYCGLHVVPVAHSSGDWPTGDRLDQRCVETHTTSEETVSGVAARRRKGHRANWSTRAKTRAYLVAESCVKQLAAPCVGSGHGTDCRCSPYRLVYDDRRAHTAETHPEWTPAHSHNDGMRVTAKAILRDLWLLARAVHEEAQEVAA